MAIKGQKFSLDLDADNFQFDLQDEQSGDPLETFNVVREIKEREPTDALPPPPKLKSKSGFPEHRPRVVVSRFKQRQQQQNPDTPTSIKYGEPSDRAIAHHIGQKYGFDTEAKEKAQISEENRRKIADMSTEEIQEARAEIMSGLNPVLIQRLLGRANIEEDLSTQNWEAEEPSSQKNDSKRLSIEIEPDMLQDAGVKKVKFAELSSARQAEHGVESDTHGKQAFTHDVSSTNRHPGAERPNNSDTKEQSTLNNGAPTDSSMSGPSTHFPVPPRDAAAFPSLDPNSATFLEDLRSHYFPDTPHDPNSLAWLQDPTEEDNSTSAYAPTQHAYAPSDIRFDFAGRLIPPSESETIAIDKGLHHHGDAPNSAGYTIPELAILCRSSLPNQRCIAYQTLGRILYRLGRGDFGPKGTELNEGLWSCIEHERPLEVIMAEANRRGGHMSAKTYAIEALWLWRRGGGGDRGVLKEGQRVVR